MKRKLIVAAAVFVAALFVNLYFSTILHQLMSNSFDGIKTISFEDCMRSIAANNSHRTIFLSVQIFVVLGLILLITSRAVSANMKMIHVTDTIKTPAVAGQKQHGSARWQTKKEIYQNFDVVRLDKNNPIIKDLMQHGYDDLTFYKNVKEGDTM